MTDQEQARRATVTTPSDREIHVEREFDAPRDLVFSTFTDPALTPEWWGPTTVVDEMDVRPGGSWRFVILGEDGSEETAFRGSYREITPPERLVQTFEWEGLPGHVHVETHTFEDLGDRTRLSAVLVFDSIEDRDGLLGSGMESGMNQTYVRMDELLATLVAR
jgi:uncharacterized protein YndB with AHSA1/START domain